MVILLPLLACDVLRFSHRFVGPLVRFQQTIQAIARGEQVRPVKLRDVETAQNTIANVAKELAASGEIELNSDSDDRVVE